MWEGGIHNLARQMGLDWLEGVDFHVTVDTVDLTGDGGGEFSTYPIVDPEIVLVAANPTAGAGVGISPVQAPCTGLANPFDFDAWARVPGFDSHHKGSRSGTYEENCGGSGGNICFAVEAGWELEPGTVDWWSLFNMMGHEMGHCLSLGHVGDGSENLLGQGWGPTTMHDIMSYSDDLRIEAGNRPKFLSKCVSTLDVELFATRMSHYLDVDGDRVIGPKDVLTPNDSSSGFQVQNPADNLYASSTGSARDCPQPDAGLVPGARTNWDPSPVPSVTATLDVKSPSAGTTVTDPEVIVAGTVGERSLYEPVVPLPSSVSYDDNAADATGEFTEIKSVNVTATASHVEVAVDLNEIWPSTQLTSPVSYSLTVDGQKFDSFVRLPAGESNPRTYDEYGWRADGMSEWDLEHNRVLFHIPREYLRENGVTAPYEVSVSTSYGQLAQSHDDWAPEIGQALQLGAPPQQLPKPIENPSADDDRDGVPDTSDGCPTHPGLAADGCTVGKSSRVEVFVDNVFAGSQDVYADYGSAEFAVPVQLGRGQHSVRVRWLDAGDVLASSEFTLTRRKGKGAG
jgi:hypothetical protein